MLGQIHSLESLAALDGEGLRYAVFFSGCPLRCVCCHNPDTWFPGGRAYSSEELAGKLCRYKPYFKKGGGVTFSGGEPLLQAPFLNETAGLLRQKGIGYDLDTSGAVELTPAVKEAVAGADLVLLDVKYPTEELYAKYTGGDFATFLKFAAYLAALGKRVWYRTVVIPALNDREEVLDQYLALVSRWRKPERYELLAFHTMGFYKYERLGLANPLLGTPPLAPERLQALQAYLDRRRAGV